jgi:hypothetical protein
VPVGLFGGLELGQLGVQVGLGGQLGQAGGDVHLGDRALVTVHRRLEEDERPVRPEAEDRGHTRRDQCHDHDQQLVILFVQAGAVLGDGHRTGLDHHADQVEAEEQRVLPAERRLGVVPVCPVSVGEIRHRGRDDGRDDGRLDRSDRHRHVGDDQVERGVGSTDDPEGEGFGGDAAQAFRQRAG